MFLLKFLGNVLQTNDYTNSVLLNDRSELIRANGLHVLHSPTQQSRCLYKAVKVLDYNMFREFLHGQYDSGLYTLIVRYLN